MSKGAIIGIVAAVVVILAGVGVYAAKHKSTTSTSPTTTTTPTTSSSDMNMESSSSSNESSSSQPSSTNTVSIKDFAFSPADITVKKGTTVTWTNSDTTTHTVTENDGQTGPDSGDLAPGKTYTFTYNTAGTFKYHCTIHSNMTGTVTVTE